MSWTGIQDNWQRITATTRKQWGKLVKVKSDADDGPVNRDSAGGNGRERSTAAAQREQAQAPQERRQQDQRGPSWFARLPRRLPFKRR